MKRKPVYITVREDSSTAIDRYPGGFPVDGDALHDRDELNRRAAAAITSDPALLAAARAWLGTPLVPGDLDTPAEVVRAINLAFDGGAPRFVAVTPSLQKEEAA